MYIMVHIVDPKWTVYYISMLSPLQKKININSPINLTKWKSQQQLSQPQKDSLAQFLQDFRIDNSNILQKHEQFITETEDYLW